MLRAALPGLAVATGGLDALAACEVVVACAAVPHRDGAPRARVPGGKTRRSWRRSPTRSRSRTRALPRARARQQPGRRARHVAAAPARRAHARGRPRAQRHPAAARRGRTRRGCDPAEVEAWSVGEHGPLAVPLLSRVRVRGVPVGCPPPSARRCSARSAAGTSAGRRTAPAARARGRPAGASAALVRALLDGDPRPWPVSTLLRRRVRRRGRVPDARRAARPRTRRRALAWADVASASRSRGRAARGDRGRRRGAAGRGCACASC